MTYFPKVKANKSSLSKRRLIYGIGVNDANYMVRVRIDGKYHTCPYYKSWHHMLERCYSDKYQKTHPSYNGCSVSEQWLTFIPFKNWMASQDWKGMDLDKDIICPRNKIYSPEKCVFVGNGVNKILKKSLTIDSVKVLPYARNGKYRARIHIDGKEITIGEFDTPEEAVKIYRIAKHDNIVRVAFQQSDTRVKAGLLLHAELILNGKNNGRVQNGTTNRITDPLWH